MFVYSHSTSASEESAVGLVTVHVKTVVDEVMSPEDSSSELEVTSGSILVSTIVKSVRASSGRGV